MKVPQIKSIIAAVLKLKVSNRIIQLFKSIVAAVLKLKKQVSNRIILLIGKIRMYLGIKGATAVHRVMSKPYVDKNNKEVRNYIVLLELPVKKKNRIYWKERLHWVNRNNFRRLKRKGWIQKGIQLNDLRTKAFYMSDLKRTYSEEFAAREKATDRYLNYLKENL